MEGAAHRSRRPPECGRPTSRNEGGAPRECGRTPGGREARSGEGVPLRCPTGVRVHLKDRVCDDVSARLYALVRDDVAGVLRALVEDGAARRVERFDVELAMLFGDDLADLDGSVRESAGGT